MSKYPRLLILLPFALLAASLAAQEKPNIVLLLSDDQGWTDYGFMGHPLIQTPELDRLAEEGTVFERGYVPTALCRPSLASLATGLYAHQHKITGNDPSHRLADPKKNPERYNELVAQLIANIDRHPTLPELLGEQGYLSHQSGKWWEGSYQRGGFTHGMTLGYPNPDGRHGDVGLTIGREGVQPVLDFIDSAVEAEKPFFVWYAPFLPHTPHNPPKRLLDKYQDKVDSIHVARYYAMCEWLDETCGEVMDHIESKGLSKNTLFVYVCDNGWIQDPKRRKFVPGSKLSPNEMGTRQPIIFKWEGVIDPRNRGYELASSIDIIPTLLAAGGARIPDNLQGYNLLPILKSGEPTPRLQVFGESFAHDIASLEDPQASLLFRWVIEGRWKLMVNYRGQSGRYGSLYPGRGETPQLYDLINDPHETENLSSSYPGLVEHLIGQLNDWYPVERVEAVIEPTITRFAAVPANAAVSFTGSKNTVTAGTPTNIAALGPADWAIWNGAVGAGAPAEQKAGGRQIGNLGTVGTFGTAGFSGTSVFTWASGGAPTASSTGYTAGTVSEEFKNELGLNEGYTVDVALLTASGTITFWGINRGSGMNTNTLTIVDSNDHELYSDSDSPTTARTWHETTYSMDWTGATIGEIVTLQYLKTSANDPTTRIGLSGIAVTPEPSEAALLLGLDAGDDPMPVPMPTRIYSGTKSQTKTYMHQFVDSPDGNMYAFRYFPGENQPQGAKGRNAGGDPCEIWLCNSDLTGHYKAFTSPKSEGGHGSDVIVWVTDDLIYYAGLSYQISTGEVRWKFSGDGAELPLARMHAVNPHKLYVGIRGHGEPDGHSSTKGAGSEARGWYWLDPSSPTKPELHLVSDMKNLVQYYGGSWDNAEAAYIYQNPSDTKLFVVVYDRKRRKEFAFILNSSDGSVYSYLGPNGVGRSNNGHVLWVDDETLFAGNQHPGLFDLKGNLISRPAGKGQGNHISISPDKKWWVGDIHREHVVRLYKFGSSDSVVISGNVKYDNLHPSFSRDGKYVFFQGKKPDEPHMGVYRVDVSGIISAKEEDDARSE